MKRTLVWVAVMVMAVTPALLASPDAHMGAIEELIGIQPGRYAVRVVEHYNPGSYYEGKRIEWREVRSTEDGSVLERVRLLEVHWEVGAFPEREDYGVRTDTVVYEAPPEVLDHSQWETALPIEGEVPVFRQEGRNVYVGTHGPRILVFDYPYEQPVRAVARGHGFWYLAVGEGEVYLDVVIPLTLVAVREEAFQDH